MMNKIWAVMLLLGLGFAVFTGNGAELGQIFSESGERAVAMIVGLLGTLTLWSGLNRIAQKAGLVDLLGKLLNPLFRLLFPTLKNYPEARAAIIMNVCANFFGLGNAATPLGLEAMRLMQEKNQHKEEATDAMCTLLALNTTGLTLFPATVVGLRIAAGSAAPHAIVLSALLASFAATIVGLTVDRLLRQRRGGARG